MRASARVGQALALPLSAVNDFAAPMLGQKGLHFSETEAQQPAVQLIAGQSATQQRMEGGFSEAQFLTDGFRGH